MSQLLSCRPHPLSAAEDIIATSDQLSPAIIGAIFDRNNN